MRSKILVLVLSFLSITVSAHETKFLCHESNVTGNVQISSIEVGINTENNLPTSIENLTINFKDSSLLTLGKFESNDKSKLGTFPGDYGNADDFATYPKMVFVKKHTHSESAFFEFIDGNATAWFYFNASRVDSKVLEATASGRLSCTKISPVY